MRAGEDRPMIGTLVAVPIAIVPQDMAPPVPFWTRPDSPTDALVIREIFSENVYRVAQADIEGGTVIDIGANIGAFSVLALVRGAQRVIAVEPEPDNAMVLGANISPYPSITHRSVAIWSEAGTLQLAPAHGGTRVDLTGALAVLSLPLAALFTDEAIEECAVLKMDIEGAEYEVMRVTPSALLAKVRYITMEFHNTDAETFGALVAKLTQTHAVQTLGSYERGGYIYARRY